MLTAFGVKPFHTALLLFLVACDLGEVDPIEKATEVLAAGGDPCKDPDIRQANVKKNADGKFVGTNGRDVIFGTNGNDIIFGNGGDDLICGLAGDDYIEAATVAT